MESISNLVNIFAGGFFPDNESRVRSYMEQIGRGYYKCRDCEYGPSIYGNVKSHIESKHYSPGYVCMHCNKMYRMEKVMKTHQKKCCVQGNPEVIVYKNLQ